MAEYIEKRKPWESMFSRLLWWMINGTAAAAPPALRLAIAGRLRIGLSMTPASLALADRQDKSRTGSKYSNEPETQ